MSAIATYHQQSESFAVDLLTTNVDGFVNRTVKWIRTYMRGKGEERPEQIRVGDEIMQFLIKRETSLADALDALDALTAVMLNALAAKYGKRDEFFRLSEQVSRFPGSTERDRAVRLIPTKQPGGLAAKVHPRTVTMVERPEGISRLAIEVGQIITQSGPKSFGDGLDALTSTMLTAIEATCGRERADEFDFRMDKFSKEVISLSQDNDNKGTPQKK